MQNQKKKSAVSRTKQPDPYRPNVWFVVNNFLLSSIHKGQLPLAGTLLIILVFLFKMEGTDLTSLANRIIDLCVDLYTLGWALSVVISAAWMVSSRFSRKIYKQRMEQIANEKNGLQQKLTKEPLTTSRVINN